MNAVTVTEERVEAKGLAQLYERNAPAAVRLAYLITSDPDLAQDIEVRRELNGIGFGT